MPNIGNVYTFNPSGLSVMRGNNIVAELADNLPDITGVVELEGTQTRGNIESPIWIVRVIDARLNTDLPWEGVELDTTIIVPEEAFRTRRSNTLEAFTHMIEANREMLRRLTPQQEQFTAGIANEEERVPVAAAVAAAPLTLGTDPFEDFDARLMWGNTNTTVANEPGLGFIAANGDPFQQAFTQWQQQPTVVATVRPDPVPMPAETPTGRIPTPAELIRANLMDATPFNTRDLVRGEWEINNPESLILMNSAARNRGTSLGTADYEQRGRNYMFVLNTPDPRVVFPVRNRIDGSIAYLDREGCLWVNEFSHPNVNRIFDVNSTRCAKDDAARIRFCRLGFYHDMNGGERRTTQFIASKPLKLSRKKLYRKRPIPEIKDEKEYRSAKYIA